MQVCLKGPVPLSREKAKAVEDQGTHRRRLSKSQINRGIVKSQTQHDLFAVRAQKLDAPPSQKFALNNSQPTDFLR